VEISIPDLERRFAVAGQALDVYVQPLALLGEAQSLGGQRDSRRWYVEKSATDIVRRLRD